MLHKPEHTAVAKEDVELQPKIRKPYAKPETILELELETRAGSPLSIPDPLDPLSLYPKK